MEEPSLREHDTKCYMCFGETVPGDPNTLKLWPCPECTSVAHLECLVREEHMEKDILVPLCGQQHPLLPDQCVHIQSLPTVLQKGRQNGTMPRALYIAHMCVPPFLTCLTVYVASELRHSMVDLLAFLILALSVRKTTTHYTHSIGIIYILGIMAISDQYLTVGAAFGVLFFLYKAHLDVFSGLIIIGGRWMATRDVDMALYIWTMLHILIVFTWKIYDEFYGGHSPRPLFHITPKEMST